MPLSQMGEGGGAPSEFAKLSERLTPSRSVPGNKSQKAITTDVSSNEPA